MSRLKFFILFILIAQLNCFEATTTKQTEESESEEEEEPQQPSIDESMKNLQKSTTDSEAELVMDDEKSGGIKKSWVAQF